MIYVLFFVNVGNYISGVVVLLNIFLVNLFIVYIVIVVVSIFYFVFGGMKSVVYVIVLYIVMKYCGIIIILVFVLFKIGGIVFMV